MPFEPNDYVLDQMLTLIELWKDKSRKPNSKLNDSMPTKKFLSMIKSAPSKELFIKYWENIPAIQELLEKPNFDEVKLKSDESEIDQSLETQPIEQPTIDTMADEPQDSLDQISVSSADEPATPVETGTKPEVPAGLSPKDIVSQMATRRKNRVMEARKNLRKLR